MSLQEETDEAIEEYNDIIDQQAELRKQYEELEQQRLVLFGKVQTLSGLLSQEKASEEEEKSEPAPKSAKAAK